MNKNIISMGHGISEPIGLEYIASSLIPSGHSPHFLNRHELELSLPGMSNNISLFSATTPEWNEVLVLNQKAKDRGNITVIGGYHITGVYQFEKEVPFDYAVIGEGEDVIIDVLNDIKKSNGRKHLDKGKPKLFFAKPIQDINKLPYPLRDNQYFKKYGIIDLMWPPPSQQVNTAILLCSRGCNNECSFCASAAMWGNRIRLRSIDNIIEEITKLKETFQSNTLVFVDQAFGENTEWTKELCNAFINNKFDFKWYLQTNLTINPSLIPLMAKAGCTKMGFGVEGISPAAMDIIKPTNRKSIDEINDLFRLCNSHGIFVKAYLMLGFPWETKEILAEYFEWLPKIEANLIKISYYTPFPGTKDWDKYSNQLVTKDWSKFDTVQMPVVLNPVISVNEYIEVKKKLFHSFYLSEEFKKTNTNIISGYTHYKESFLDFYHFLQQFEMIPAEISYEDWLPDHLEAV